jgi:hypothetical protein
MALLKRNAMQIIQSSCRIIANGSRYLAVPKQLMEIKRARRGQPGRCRPTAVGLARRAESVDQLRPKRGAKSKRRFKSEVQQGSIDSMAE